MSMTFDNKWEEQYQQGHTQRYPWDSVISFFFRHRAPFGPNPRVLEVGCGTASNLYALAKEGAKVTGVDGSKTAIEYAQGRFDRAQLDGTLEVRDFTKLDYPANSFDMLIDRGALCNCTKKAAKETVQSLAAATVKGGVFHSQLYSKKHSDYSPETEDKDGLSHNVKFVYGTQMSFYDEEDFRDMFADDWEIISLVDVVKEDLLTGHIHAEMHLIAKKQ